MVVGKAAAGKTTLIHRLSRVKKLPRIDSTDGIDLGEFYLGDIRFGFLIIYFFHTHN